MSIERRALLASLVLAAPAARAQDTAGPAGSWRVEAIGADRLPPDAARSDITFTAEHRAYGTTGCNRFTGGFVLDGPSLRFGPVAGTRMACEDALMERERRFHEALEAVRGWRMDGAALLLVDAADQPVLRLARAAAP